MSRLLVAASSMSLTVAATPITAVPLTLSAWVRPTTHTTTAAIFGFVDGANDSFFIEMLSTGFFAARTRSDVTGTSRATSVTSFSDGVWYHVLGVFSANNSRDIYTNGGGTANNNASNTPVGIDRTKVGEHPGIGGFFDGRVAECAAWSVALTAGEISALAKGVSPLRVRRTSLRCFYPLRGFQSPEQNVVGTSSLTLNNSPTSAGGPPTLRKTLVG